MKTVAVVSSKGGVGKTTISISLAHFFSTKSKRVTIVDGDVNAPNVAKWFEIKEWDYIKEVKIFPLPKRYENCEELKIICNGREFPVERDKRGEVRVIRDYAFPDQKYTVHIISGEITKGKTGSGKVVEEVIKHEVKGVESDIKIIDTAPGTGYPVLTAVGEADYVIIVTEATKLGLYDLMKLYDIVKSRKKACGVIVNRGDADKIVVDRIREVAQDDFLGVIPTTPTVTAALEQKIPPIIQEVNVIGEEILALLERPSTPKAL